MLTPLFLGYVMSIDSAFLGDFVQALYAAKSFEQRFKVYEQYIQKLGFEGGTYTYIPRIRLEAELCTELVFAHTDGYPSTFLDHYQGDRLDADDFTLRKAQGWKVSDELLTMDWRAYEMQGLVNRNEQRLIMLARDEYNIKNALSMHTMHIGGLSGSSIISSENDTTFELLKQDKMDTLYHCARLFHDINATSSNVSNRFVLPILASLTPTELFILRYLSSGKALKNINYESNVSYKYAANKLGDIRKRLGVKTQDRLMYLVGLLNFLDY